MKEIILRQAQLKDYDTFLHIRTTLNSSLLYGYSNRDGNPNPSEMEIEAERILDSYLKKHPPHDIIDLYEEYKNEINNFFLIIVDGVYSGLVQIRKEKKKVVRITDLCIINRAIIREIYLIRIFKKIFEITNADEMYTLCCNDFFTNMAIRIGFESLDGGIRWEKKRKR
ncbi:MAG: hypothetical protein IKQ33_04860 [Clostridia bacterium]|nr:hypothetical protein [Clostridia bacterium]